MAPISQDLEPPAKPGGFNPKSNSPVSELGQAQSTSSSKSQKFSTDNKDVRTIQPCNQRPKAQGSRWCASLIRKIEMPMHVDKVVAFCAILATILSSLAGAGVWAIVACASTLALISLTSRLGAFARYGLVGDVVSVPVIYASTIFNAAATSGSAFVAGRVIGWAWGL
jgi:hypothetical protein